MPIQLTEELVLLCEGLADKAFFTTLLRDRQNMPRFDIPFPEARGELETGQEPLGGRDRFGEMLRAIRVPIGFRRVRGILIVADSANDPAATFNIVRDQILSTPGYSVPGKPLVLSAQSADNPGIMVMFMPNEEKPGSIETLYVDEMVVSKGGAILNCVDRFLSCEQIPALEWSPEKRDKARFHSMIAALYKPDPSRAASMIWNRRGAAPLLMNINAHCFDSVENRIRNFAAAVGLAGVAVAM